MTSPGILLIVSQRQQMELINECSIRFAEDKDFRLIVCKISYGLQAYRVE